MPIQNIENKLIAVLYFSVIRAVKYITILYLDDQHRNTNMNNKDYLVGQLDIIKILNLRINYYPHAN